MIDNVIFDVCGVLVDWQPRRALDGLFSPDQIDEFFADDDRCGFLYFDDLHDGGTDYADLIDEYEREYGARLGLRMRAYAAHVERTLVSTIPGMMSLIEDLKSAGVGVWALTNWGHDTWPIMRNRFPDLFDTLDGVMVSGVEGVRKPDRAAFDLAITRFAVERGHTLFVDDSPYNVDGARAAGLTAIRFDSAEQTRNWLTDHGVISRAEHHPSTSWA